MNGVRGRLPTKGILCSSVSCLGASSACDGFGPVAAAVYATREAECYMWYSEVSGYVETPLEASSSLRTLEAVAALGAFQAADGALVAHATVAWLLLLHAAAALKLEF